MRVYRDKGVKKDVSFLTHHSFKVTLQVHWFPEWSHDDASVKMFAMHVRLSLV